MRRTLALVFVSLVSQCALAESKAWQDTITLPTWIEGAPGIDPKLDALDPEHSFYPYTERRNFTAQQDPQVWRRLNLENEYIQCSFLPDLGGHLYTCTDKRTGHAMFRAAGSIKKADIAPRGAWIATGMEFSFPVAHSRDTVSPVDFGLRQEKDHAEVWVGDTDRTTGLRWLCEFILRDGRAALEQRVTLSNPTAARHPYLWWANADLELNAGTTFEYPAHVMASEGLNDLYPWPRGEHGADWSKPFTLADMIGIFAYGSREPFMAVYDAGSRTATVHVADPGVVAGKKLYHWGAPNYKWVREHLSDNNSLYIEMQPGLFANQETHKFLQPGEDVRFTELWMPGRDLSGVSRANQDAILSLERTPPKNDLTLELNVPHPIPGAALALYQGAAAVWQQHTDLSPDRAFEHSLPNPQKQPYRFELRDRSGKLLLSHTEGVYEAVTRDSVTLGPQPSQAPSAKRDSPANCLALGQYNEKKSLYLFAENDYRECIKKFPNNLELDKSLGRLLVAEGRYAEGADALGKIGEKLALDPELHYYLGMALASTGKEAEARKSWSIATSDAQFGPPALLQLAAMESRAGHPNPALAYARQAGSRRPSLLEARDAEVALLRRSGDKVTARNQADAALALDPTDSFLRLEAVKLGAKDDAIWTHLAADAQRVIALAEDYAQLGFYDDALDLLARQYQPVPANESEPGATLPQANALVTYLRAYFESKLGRDPAADYKLASSQPLKYVFPHGPIPQNALAAALKFDPKDASAIFLMGLIDLDQNRLTDAVNQFSAALALRKDLPAIYYLLGRTLLLIAPEKKADAEAILREGVKLNAADEELKAALDHSLHPAARSAPSTASAAAEAAAAPEPALKNPATPLGSAMAALSNAADGHASIGDFNPRDFKDAKQPAAVRQAYVEVQLQEMRFRAAHKDCSTALTDLDHLGAENKDLTFTMEGFDAFTNGARFQYYMGAVESLCGLSKEAKRRWSKVAKMTPAIDSPDFAFPAVAAQSLGMPAKSYDLDAQLHKVDAAMDHTPDSKSVLSYSRGILLLAKGDEHAAVAAFARGADSQQRDFAWYLNRLALVEASHAGPVK